MHSSSTHKADTTKTVNSFLFVCFSQVQKLLSSVLRWLKKYTFNRCFLYYKRHTTTALLIRCYSSAGRTVQLFQRSASLFNNS